MRACACVSNIGILLIKALLLHGIATLVKVIMGGQDYMQNAVLVEGVTFLFRP